MCSFVISIFLKACESWTLTAELEKRMQAFEMRCYRRLLNSSYKDHVTNEEVCRKIQAAIGEYGELLTLVKKRKLRWFGHVLRSSGLAKMILQGKNKKNITVFLKKMQLLTTCYIALFCIGMLTKCEKSMTFKPFDILRLRINTVCIINLQFLSN